jgi:hypothetical protein
MQTLSNIRRDSISSESKNTNDDIQPPPYPSVIYKVGNYSHQNHDGTTPPPPSYSDINDPSAVYINNYPGPPLTDGVVQIVTSNSNSNVRRTTVENVLSERVRRYLTFNGILTILFGLIVIGLQIGLIASHSIVYYYYGFWAGALIISIGISTIMFNSRYQAYDLRKYLRSFVWQAVFVAVVFGFGIIIILTDTCDNQKSENDGNDDSCQQSYKILNGFLLTIIALAFLQSIINTFIIAILKRRYMPDSSLAS